jgi:hypothetical protein
MNVEGALGDNAIRLGSANQSRNLQIAKASNERVKPASNQLMKTLLVTKWQCSQSISIAGSGGM